MQKLKGFENPSDVANHPLRPTQRVGSAQIIKQIEAFDTEIQEIEKNMQGARKTSNKSLVSTLKTQKANSSFTKDQLMKQ